MNRDAGDLWEFFLHAEFQFAGDVVDLGDRQAAIHGAVAGDQDFVLDLADVNFVAIHQLVKFAGQRVDVFFDGAAEPGHLAALAIHGSDVRAERLDVDIHFRVGAVR